ncbi:MAG: hypothetical protein JWQ80_827 [Massilia sp.]|nr:hypothetical protein [Massilia sp.]
MRISPPRPFGLLTVMPGTRLSTSATLVSPYFAISSWPTTILVAVSSRRGS